MKHALHVDGRPTCVLGHGSNCKRACYARNLAEYDEIAPRQWWQSRATGGGGDGESGSDTDDGARRRWKENRRKRLGLPTPADAAAVDAAAA